MKKIISSWSIRGGDGSRPITELMDEAKAAGFDGIELCVAEKGVLTPETDRKTCESYRDAAKSRGLVLETMASGMTWGCSATNVDPAIRAKAINLHAGALERASWIGCKAMLFVPGAVTIPWDATYPPVPYEQAVTWAREAVTQLAKVAERVDVDLCVENVWNGLMYSPVEFASFIDSIKSPKVGVYFDAGNGLGYHQYPPHWIAILGKRIKRIHIKDYKIAVAGLAGFCDLLAGDVPFPAIMAALKVVGYDSTIVAEMMPPDATLLARTKAAMDKIFAMGATAKNAK